MQFYNNPSPELWDNLSRRPSSDSKDISGIVKSIMAEVKTGGDKALLRFTRKFDAPNLTSLPVTEEEIQAAESLVPQELKDAIRQAEKNIRLFHEAQKTDDIEVETMPGVTCYRKSVAIQNVGLYIPGGTAPLFSTLLMLGVPATIAGCDNITITTPPNKDGSIAPAILFTAQLLGIKNIFKAGGAQAIAALTYGTESIPKADKILGPGNQYVTVAKQLATLQGTAIDMPAGPSEVLVIADEDANPTFVAADLLSQAEHGTDSQVVLLCLSDNFRKAVSLEIEIQLQKLPRKEIAEKALKNSRSIIFNDIETCLQFSNTYAPEHLILALENPDIFIPDIKNAGSVFLGKYTCESAGDYASGTNHTLPTAGYARSYSGVSLDSFYKKITFQKITKQGIQNIGKIIEIMAESEGLQAHKNAVSLRLTAIKNEELIMNN